MTWVILSEIYPTAVRGRALGLATFFLWMADYAVTQTFPMMDAKDSWFVQHFNHAFPFYIYAVFCVVLFLVVWPLVPETKGSRWRKLIRAWVKGHDNSSSSQETWKKSRFSRQQDGASPTLLG